MFRFAIGVAVVMSAVTSANAQADKPRINVELQNVERAGAVINVVFKADNMSAAPARVVFVRCTLFDKDERALDTALASINDVQGGVAKYGKVTILRKTNDTKFAACDVDNAV